MPTLGSKPMHAGGLLSHCVVCTARIPLRVPRDGEPGTHWQCAQCGTRYLALLQENCPIDLLQNVRQVDGEQAPDQTRGAVLAAALLSERFAPQGSAKVALPARSGMVCPWQNSMTRQLDSELVD